MNVLRHDHIADNHEALALPSLLQNREQAVAAGGGVKKRQAPVARASDKVQVMGTVSTMQSTGHTKPIVPAASYPPLQKTQGQGTPSFGTGKKNETEGWATRHPQFRNGNEKRDRRMGHPPIAARRPGA